MGNAHFWSRMCLIKRTTFWGWMLGLMAFSTIAWTWLPQKATTPLTLEVQPAAIQLSVGGQTEVTVIARNPSDTPLTGVALSWYGDLTAALATGQAGAPVTLPAGGSVTWRMLITSKATTRSSAKLIFRADYTQAALAQTVFAPLDATLLPPKSISDLASLSIVYNPATLDDQHSANLYLLVQNKSALPLTLEDVQVHLPTAMLTATRQDPSSTQGEIPPGSVRAVTYLLKPTGQITPGTYPLVFEASLRWNDGRDQSASLTASQNVTLGVFGETPILGVFQVPAFFLLPGFLALLTFKFLWKKGKPGDEKIPLTSPEFWLGAISLSFLIALWLYPLLLKIITGNERTYLFSYGFMDVVYAWILSVVTGLLIYAFALAIPPALMKVQQAILRTIQALTTDRRTFHAGDTPEKVLEKLLRQKQTLTLMRCTYSGVPDPNMRVYRLYPPQEDASSYWIAPEIKIGAPPNADQKQADDLKADASALIDKDALKDLLKLLKKNPKDLYVYWDPNHPLKEISYVPTETLVEKGGKMAIVSLD